VKREKWKPFQKDHKVADKQNMKCGLNGLASLFSNICKRNKRAAKSGIIKIFALVFCPNGHSY